MALVASGGRSGLTPRPETRRLDNGPGWEYDPWVSAVRPHGLSGTIPATVPRLDS